MKNKLSDLRNHLFETIEALKDEEKPMDLKRADAIVKVAQAITETAKVEVKFLDVTGETPGNDFFVIEGDMTRRNSPPNPLKLTTGGRRS